MPYREITPEVRLRIAAASKRWRERYKQKHGVNYSTEAYRANRKPLPKIECVTCGKMFRPKTKRAHACSKKCSSVESKLRSKGLW